MTDEYKNYADHPRYGRGPRVTGLNPKDTTEKYQHLTGDELENSGFYEEEYVSFHWHSQEKYRIANTAVVADESKLGDISVGVSYYFDVKRNCLDCKKTFIFFAEEQKYWYEELGFNLSANSVRCFSCRKKRKVGSNNLAKLREQYQELYQTKNRTRYETLEMAKYCLTLIELKDFSKRKSEMVRMLLNQLSNEDGEKIVNDINEVRQRLLRLDSTTS